MVVALLGTRPATRPPALLTALVLLLVAADAIRLGVAQLRASASPPTGDKHQIRKLFKTARLHIRRNQLDEARPLLRRCLQIDGADAHSWLALATLEERSGDVEGAKRVYTSAHAVCPSNVRLLHAQGVLEARHGEASAARELFARAEALDPGSAYVAHAWGQLERRLGNSAAAMGVYRRAIDAKPNAEVCAAAAALEAQEGNVTAARGLYRQAVALALAAPPSAADADGDDGGCGAAVRWVGDGYWVAHWWRAQAPRRHPCPRRRPHRSARAWRLAAPTTAGAPTPSGPTRWRAWTRRAGGRRRPPTWARGGAAWRRGPRGRRRGARGAW